LAKNPNRVAAGRRVWARKSPAEKAEAIARLKGTSSSKPKKSTPSNSRGSGGNVAKKKRKRAKQSPVTWARNVIAVGIGLGVPVAAAWKQAGSGSLPDKMGRFGDAMISYYTGLNPRNNWQFDANRLAVGVGSAAGALVFHKASGMIVQKVKIPSLLPKL